MSAMTAIHARAVAELSAFLEAERQRRGWSYMDFATAAFGVNDKGDTKNQSYTRTLLSGKSKCLPSHKTLAQIAKALDVPVERLLMLRDGNPAVLSPLAVAPPVSAVSKAREQFALTIDTEGRATLRVSLTDVPMALAFRAMAALTSAGVLPTGAEVQAHE